MADQEDEIIEPTEVSEPEDDGAQHVCLHIKRTLAIRRVDKYVNYRFPDFSRTLIQRLIEEGALTVNGHTVKRSYQLSPGDQIDVILPPPPPQTVEPEPIDLKVIYEDEHMLVINKQADLLVHPARGNRGGTLVNGLVYYSNSLSQVNGQFRPGIIHRLDRNTTGVIVIAKTDMAHFRLAYQFEHRKVRKEYTAVVQGTMELNADVVNMPLGRHPRVREKYAARPETGKPAVTGYQVQKQYRGYALMKLMPQTGRTHQIRVHMSYIKHPIVGDTVYGGGMMTLGQMANGQERPGPEEPGGRLGVDEAVINRQALHASRLTINHPISRESMCFEAEIPADMQLLIDLLERYRRL